MTTRTDETVCKHCGKAIYLFDKAPADFADETGAGWATDESGDISADFECPAREATGRWPNGKPHEPDAVEHIVDEKTDRLLPEDVLYDWYHNGVTLSDVRVYVEQMEREI